MRQVSAMSGERYLIVNADDFGLSVGVNRGIVAAHERGIVTSASLMVRGAAAADAAEYARGHQALALGLHVDLGEWSYRNEAWEMRYQVVPADDPVAVAAEVVRQLDRFRELAGCDPTHIDSHQHVHREEPARSILCAKAAELGVPLRHVSEEIRYCGAFYGQAAKGYPYPDGITVEALIGIVRGLLPGATELGCHPATEADTGSVYDAERVAECRALCDPRVRQAIAGEGIVLRSFRAYGTAMRRR